MDKSNMTFQVFSSIPEHERKTQNNNTMSKPKLLPTGVQANESPQTNCGCNDNGMYPLEVQRQQANDQAAEFQKNLPRYKKICDKVYEAADVENNAAEVEPMLPPVIS